MVTPSLLRYKVKYDIIALGDKAEFQNDEMESFAVSITYHVPRQLLWDETGRYSITRKTAAFLRGTCLSPLFI